MFQFRPGFQSRVGGGPRGPAPAGTAATRTVQLAYNARLVIPHGGLPGPVKGGGVLGPGCGAEQGDVIHVNGVRKGRVIGWLRPLRVPLVLAAQRGPGLELLPVI